MSSYEHLIGIMKSRRSVRRFAERAVGRDDLLRVLEAARWAPSNHNRQPWRFVVLEERREILELAEGIRAGLCEKLKSLPAIAAGYAEELTSYATFFDQAPVLLLVLHKRPISISNALLTGVSQPALVSGEPLSVAMAVQNLLLAAQALGLGTCVLTAPLLVEEVVMTHLRVPPGYEPTCLVALGFPLEDPPPPRRKSIEQIVEFRKDTHGLKKATDDRT
jgi:coenzyme F420-0:L-glutamate ligase / coenzyme F420-1:gamma-L-glutamate ligase